MPSVEAPQQQQPMEATQNATVTEQPRAEPQPEVTMRGGLMEECNCCCFGEECVCC